jgi:hypothetical protein
MVNKAKVQELVLVLIGEFNPIIIQPSWLVHKGLIRESEGTGSETDIIHNEVTRFDLGWGNLEISRQRFMIRTTDESSFSVAKDLTVSIFNILKETPVKYLGINHVLHYELNANQYDDLGNKLAPFGNWEGFMKNPKLIQLEMQELPRKDGLPGHYKIRLGVSELIKLYGVSVNINDQYNATAASFGTTELISHLNNSMESSLDRATDACDQLWKNAGI